MPAFEDIFGGLFDESQEGRQAAFSTLLSGLSRQPGGPINQFNRDIFENQFGSFFNRFVGDTGQRILAGEAPETFAEYAKRNYTARDARRQAVGSRRSAPITSRARFLFRR